MAKGRKTGGRNFKKGHPGGPGAPKLPAEVREVKRATKADVIKSFEKILSMNVSELTLLLGEDTLGQTRSIDAALAAIMMRAIKFGDHQSLNSILDRLYGKPKEPKQEDPLKDHDDFLDTIPRQVLLKAAKT